jgi:L-ascorbate metabolism protein UlaG (beta-lactamase superfamily)
MEGISMRIQLLRHATLLVTLGGKTLLVDPMLSEREAMDPIINSPNDRRNPLVDLAGPCDYLERMDAVLITHTHRDHFDDAAAAKLPKHKPIFCQPADAAKLQSLGFVEVLPIEASVEWQGIRMQRTSGQHGTGDIGAMMAPVSGYILQAQAEPSLYLAGDTIYCAEVAAALAKHQPQITVVNGGGARFTTGDPITMTAEDVVQLCRQAPATKVVVVHLEAINHCLITRDDFQAAVKQHNLQHQVVIPDDGQTILC